MESTGYPPQRVTYVEGLVEETLPRTAPAQLALLRLDTDWYEATHHELVHLYPRLAPGGVLLVDDYGFFPGVRRPSTSSSPMRRSCSRGSITQHESR